mmetsp:Transcript_11106/g.21757  ORF Transcript_11106/g.21757 Transcript_11106/m.21757 type:complete len:293 (+) Transcript_11106:1271-2149(+)
MAKKNVIIVSRDVVGGKPLDFSFKYMRELQEMLVTEARSGQRHPITEGTDEEKKDNSSVAAVSGTQGKTPLVGEEELEEEQIKKKVEEKLKPPRPPAAVRVLEENATSISANKASGRNDEDVTTVVRKKLIVRETNSLILSYNNIEKLDGFIDIVSRVMLSPANLGWIDLSHNRLTALTVDLASFPLLGSLYLHANYISDLREIKKLKGAPLRSLTLYGNSIEQLRGYRLYVIGVLPQLKNLDSSLITKLERDNSVVMTETFGRRRLPYVKDPPPIPPIKESNAEPEEVPSK